jgi:uncharacterized iron-regulated membrane protein
MQKRDQGSELLTRIDDIDEGRRTRTPQELVRAQAQPFEIVNDRPRRRVVRRILETKGHIEQAQAVAPARVQQQAARAWATGASTRPYSITLPSFAYSLQTGRGGMAGGSSSLVSLVTATRLIRLLLAHRATS